MQQWSTVIRNPTGLHARPAKTFVNMAKQFLSDIRVQHGAKTANAKSLISMLTLGAECGSEIIVTVTGTDEVAALSALEELVAAGLGEAGPVEPAGPGGAPPAAGGGPAGPAAAANVLQGIAASPGIAIGPVYQFRRRATAVLETSAGAVAEQGRLEGAVAQAREQLGALGRQMARGGARDEAAIFEVHRELLDDPELLGATAEHIRGGESAAVAWQAVMESRAGALERARVTRCWRHARRTCATWRTASCGCWPAPARRTQRPCPMAPSSSWRTT